MVWNGAKYRPRRIKSLAERLKKEVQIVEDTVLAQYSWNHSMARNAIIENPQENAMTPNLWRKDWLWQSIDRLETKG